MRLLRILICGLAGVVPTAGLSASEIGSSNPVRATWDVHETISLIATRCADVPVKPETCNPGPRSILDLVEQSEGKSNSSESDHYFAHAARWSDDPLRMLDHKLSTALLGATLWNKCKRANTDGPKLDQRGLLCASHFGPLQFAHAQDDIPNGKPEDPAALAHSQTKILQWARFAFRAATAPSFAATPLCTAINDPAFKDIASSLALGKTSRCEGKHPYTVATLFSWRCPTFSFGHCDDLSQRYGLAYARQGASGAILHLIQDSYSQSHAARLPPGVAPVDARRVFPALSACQRIATFYDYNAQKDERSETHGNADKPPLIDSSCFVTGRDVDDVVTATARAIWLLQRARIPGTDVDALEEELVRDLTQRVLVVR